jgi:hypothetical protein
MPVKNLITATYHLLRTTANAIQKSINAAGYDEHEVKATIDGASALDSCCRPG